MIVKKKRNDVHKINLHLECVADIIKAFLDMKSLRTFHSQVVFRRKLLVYVSSKRRPGTSLAVQWQRFFILNARGPGSVSGQGSRSQMLQLRVSMLQLKIPDFPGGLVVSKPPSPLTAGTAGDWGSSPGLRRCPGRENANPFRYSYWANPMDRGTWQATVPGVHKELDMTE